MLSDKIMMLSGLVTLLLPVAVRASHFDVVVYGSSPAGVAAAVAAGHLGMKVALYEPLSMLGGCGAPAAFETTNHQHQSVHAVLIPLRLV